MSSFNFKSYFNFLGRNKGYTAINLVGFSAALMFVVLLGLYIHKETGVDKFHEKGDRIFRLLQDDEVSNWPPKIAEDLQARYPEIEGFARYWLLDETVDTKEESIRTKTAVVDSTFFSIFSFPLIAGDRSAPLRTKNEIILTRSFAVRVFGGVEEALGQSLNIQNQYDISRYTVAGVAEDFENSHFPNPDMIGRYDGHIFPWFLEQYGAPWSLIYLLIRENADLRPKVGDMADYFRTYYGTYQKEISKEVFLEPLAENYYGKWNSQARLRSNNKQAIRIFGIAALAVLLFAVINYVNLSVALSGFRAKEAATRRLLGGTRAGLFTGYILESVLFCAGAFAIAFFLAAAAEPVFNRVMQTDISVGGALTPGVIAGCAGLAIGLGVISGFFPALIISRHKPIEVVKGEFTRKTKMVYSRVFIGLQFCLTIVLIGCTITLRQQTNFLKNTDLGFDKEQLIHLENTVPAVQVPGLRDRLMQVPGVELVSFSQGTPVTGGEGRLITYDDGASIPFRQYVADSLFFKVLGLEVVRETGIRADSALWLNETGARMLNLSGQDDMFKTWKSEALAGIVKDFHTDDLQQEIGAVTIQILPNGATNIGSARPWDILVKINSSDPGATFRQVVDTTLEYNGGQPFESNFVDATIDSWYDEQERTGTLIGWFALIAILISALGLLAMATYFMRQRARDIAVRKVFGAANGEVLNRLVFSFLKIVLVSFVIAVPVIWYMMSRWLQTFAYRIPLSWTIFAIAGILAAVIAFIAVFWQSWRAANTNPVETLHKG